MSNENLLTDEDIEYDSLVKQKELIQSQLDNLYDKDTLVDSLRALFMRFEEAEKIDQVFNDFLNLLIESNDLFIGDNPEVFIGSDKLKYNCVCKYLQNTIMEEDAKLILEVIDDLSEEYSEEQKKLDARIMEINDRMDKLVVGRPKGPVPMSDRLREKLSENVTAYILLQGFIIVSFAMIGLFTSISVKDPLLGFGFLFALSVVLYTILNGALFNLNKKSRRRRRYKF